MSNIEHTSFKPTVEIQLPYMFANEKVLEQKVDIPHIVRELSKGEETIGLNVKFPIVVTKQSPHSNTKILLKVRKLKNKKTGEVITKEEIIGIVKDQFSYEELADFQFEPKIPQEHLINYLKNYLSTSEIPDAKQQENYLNQLPFRNLGYSILPANFSKSHNNHITSQKVLMDDYEQVLENQKEKKDERTRFQSKFINFDSEHIPIPEPLPENITDKKEYQYLIKKFEERPIWLKNVLFYEAQKTEHKFESYHIFKKILSYLAYSFKDGPWKHAYVKFKLDPRADSSTYIYQVIDLGTPDSSKSETLNQSYKRDEFETYDPYFVEPPTKQRQLYQLCDLQDPQIIEILEKEHETINSHYENNTSCDKRNGWITGKNLKTILKFMKSKFKLA